MKELICNNAVFGIALCAACWHAGLWAAARAKNPLVHPLVVAIALAAAVLAAFRIPLEWFREGANYLDMLLLPATAALGLSVWRQRQVLKENFWPVVLGCAAGALANALVAAGLCRLLALDASLTDSVLPHSVTTPIAIALSEAGGGVPAVTTLCVIFTGIMGAAFAPLLVEIFRLEEHPVAAGVAIGSASHAVGTGRAMEMSPIQGAMSSVAIGVAGILTTLLSLVW